MDREKIQEITEDIMGALTPNMEAMLLKIWRNSIIGIRDYLPDGSGEHNSCRALFKRGLISRSIQIYDWINRKGRQEELIMSKRYSINFSGGWRKAEEIAAKAGISEQDIRDNS